MYTLAEVTENIVKLGNTHRQDHYVLVAQWVKDLGPDAYDDVMFELEVLKAKVAKDVLKRAMRLAGRD